MRALVVYESMFGNTQTIADAVAGGVAHRMPVDAVEVGGAPARSTTTSRCSSSAGRPTPSG